MSKKSVSWFSPELKRLYKYVTPHVGLLFLAAIALGVNAATSSLIATLLGKMTDLGFYEKDPRIILAAPLTLIGITVIYGLSNYLGDYWLGLASQKALIKIRGEMFDRIIRWPFASYQHYTTSQIGTKFMNEGNQALAAVTKSCVMIVKDSLQIVGLLGVLFYYNWQLSIVMLLMAPLLVSAMKFISKRSKKMVASNQKTWGRLIGVVQDAYTANKLVKANDAYAIEETKFNEVNRKIRTEQVHLVKLKAMSTPMTHVISMLGVAVVVSVAMFEAQQGLITVGEFITFLSAMLLMRDPLNHLSGLNATLATMSAAATSVFEMMDVKPEEETGTEELSDMKGKVTFDHVGLTYPSASKEAVSDFNLTIKPGEHVALVGLSGSGKSSIINMLPRFWEPTSGKICVDDIDYTQVTRESLRRHIAFVTQDIVLFDDTIRANLAYGLKAVTDEQIYAALDAAALGDFVRQLPEGLDTPVGEFGGKLSGGQKQRLSIARAFLKDARILIFDEATSALDSESEHKIKLALETVTKGRTTITVAHRLSTIENADQIIVMENGRIVEQGTHQSLMSLNGRYAKLVQLQSLA